MNLTLNKGMVFAGSLLMAFNIYRYVLFSRQVRKNGNLDEERRLFRAPIVLLVLFLTGYLIIGLVGKPDLVIASVLLGGSIFVFLMLGLIQRTVNRIQENEELKIRAAAAEEANRAKTFFLSNMSHDIRTPLNAIIGYTMLAENPNATPEEKTEYIRKIDRAGRQLLDIVNDVLEMSRIESGRVDLQPAVCSLEEVTREAEDLVRNQMKEKGLDFSVRLALSHPWVLCDRNQMNRILMNLLCNAAKFTESGGSVTLGVRELGTAGNTGTYEFRVKDTGIGMSPDFVEHIFTPFERERTSTVSRIQGTGLGMAITKNLISLMDGRIEVETEQGKGTEFIVTVPFPITSAPENAKEAAAERDSLEGCRLLLAEDNPINMEIARMILSQAGIETDTAENGKEAVKKVAEAAPGTYDAVLMDIQMPEMDGYTATRAIRALPDAAKARIPIIAMTANAFQEDVQMAVEAGMSGHIAKPLDLDRMMETLRTVLKAEGEAP